jgi:methionyl aminopeptidase
MTAAIEPMINMGTKNTKHLKVLDDFADGKPSAHFEHRYVYKWKTRNCLTFKYKVLLGIESNEEEEFRNHYTF